MSIGRTLQQRAWQLDSLDVLRLTVKVICDDVAPILLGEPLKSLRQFLLTKASKPDLANHVDLPLLDEKRDQMFTYYLECYHLSHQGEAYGQDVEGALEELAQALLQQLGQLFVVDEIWLEQAVRLEWAEIQDAVAASAGGLPPVVGPGARNLLRVLEQFARRKHDLKLALRLRLSLSGDQALKIAVLDRYNELQSEEEGRLPYRPQELPALHKIIRAAETVEELALSQREQELLLAWGLLLEGEHHGWLDRLRRKRSLHLERERHLRIGRSLFDALFANSLQPTYQEWRRSNKPLALRLFFESNDAILPRLPWELLSNASHHLTVGQHSIELVRALDIETPVWPRLETELPLRLLFVDADPAAPREREAVRRGLAPFARRRRLAWRQLDGPCWQEVLDALQEPADIVHFSVPGLFGRWCGNCGQVSPARLSRCATCGLELQEETAEGYLAFRNGEQVEWVRPKHLASALDRKEVALIVLSADGSGMVGEANPFHGIAPALLHAGIPAVVALQDEMEVGLRSHFMGRFYAGLARSETLPEALNNARLEIEQADEAAWFQPVLYLHTRGRYGSLHFRSPERVRSDERGAAGRLRAAAGPFGGDAFVIRPVRPAAAQEAPGIPNPLLMQLVSLLVRCEPFRSNGELHALFVDARLAPFRYKLPEAASIQGRVYALVDYLLDQREAGSGTSALITFLQVLAEGMDVQDERRGSLQKLAEQLHLLDSRSRP